MYQIFFLDTVDKPRYDTVDFFDLCNKIYKTVI
ncbi:MAG TPA: palindromic element RPE4 domain-containing protein [Rickettsia endosymbiont of Pyrocoelia pectoralis]|nr:palindromic element RPE4 domain-containing protein [Rickettsia endosymbiont of Pyrocoelia pectoralis]